MFSIKLARVESLRKKEIIIKSSKMKKRKRGVSKGWRYVGKSEFRRLMDKLFVLPGYFKNGLYGSEPGPQCQFVCLWFSCGEK